MKSSEILGSLAPALATAQRDFRAIGKDATNPDYRSSYSTLDKIVETVRPILAANGLAVVQGATAGKAPNTLLVETRIIHLSGEWIESSVVMPLVGRMLKGGGRAEPDPQSGGSAVSYGRRYGLCAALGLVTGEDDDGNAASRAPKVQREARPAAPPRPAAVLPQPVRDIPRWLGLAKDRPMPFGKHKGQLLGTIDTKTLQDAELWCKNQSDANAKDLAKDIKSVLTDRALGDGAVEKMMAGAKKDEERLPF